MVRALLKEMEEAQSRRGTLGVIVPEGMLDDMLVAARGQRIEVDAADWGRGRKITVLTPRQAKGLEFDHVLVAEPAEIAESGNAGHRQVYVSLTRSTQTLTILHARDLPAGFGERRVPALSVRSLPVWYESA